MPAISAQSRVRAFVLGLFGWTSRIAGALCGVSGFMRWRIATSDNPYVDHSVWATYGLPTILMGLGFLLLTAGMRLNRLRRQHLAPVIHSSKELVGERYVLYLRVFDDDELRTALEAPLGTRTNLLRGLTAPHFHSYRTQEEQLADAFRRKVAPMVAVGRPDEKLPLVGARRLYLPLNDWQDTVLTLIRGAQLVVLVAGTRPGFMWELVQTVHDVSPERVLLLVPMDSAEYDDFRILALRALQEHAETLRATDGEKWTPPGLPDYPEGWVPPPRTHFAIKGAISFDVSWQPQFVRFDTTDVKVRPRYPLRSAVEDGLRPVLERTRSAVAGGDRPPFGAGHP
ncbi:hypothetical protein [Streptomyces sp. NPDC020742]|uniref:hypothetical protein n=1 Tax=Streptomyces sp. NPDC020742 TaxID=3154897 RepID=UPI0033E3DEDA